MIDLDGQPVAEPIRRNVHDPVHFSDLRHMKDSPAHFRASVARVWEPTRDMRVGTIVHELVLGPHKTKPLVKYDGDDRKGNRWKDFFDSWKRQCPKCEIVTQKEWDDAEPIAAAVRADPVARRLIDGARREVDLAWESAGIKCETDGIDLVGVGYLGDLKRTSCTEPEGFSRHAFRNLWHSQMTFYEEGARLCGIDTSKGLYLLGVEPDPPYAVTVLELTEPVIEHGRQSCIKWLEALRVARDNDHWPAYTQSVVNFELPPWMVEDEG